MGVALRVWFLGVAASLLAVSMLPAASWTGSYLLTRGDETVGREDLDLSATGGRMVLQGTLRREVAGGVATVGYRLGADAPSMATRRYARVLRPPSGTHVSVRVSLRETADGSSAVVSSATTATVAVGGGALLLDRETVGPWVLVVASYDRAARGLQRRPCLVVPETAVGELSIDYRGEDVAPGAPTERLRRHHVEGPLGPVDIWSDLLGRVVRISRADGSQAWLEGWRGRFSPVTLAADPRPVRSREVTLPTSSAMVDAMLVEPTRGVDDGPSLVLVPDPLDDPAAGRPSLAVPLAESLASAGITVLVLRPRVGVAGTADAVTAGVLDLLSRRGLSRDKVLVGAVGDGAVAALRAVRRAPVDDVPGRVAGLLLVDPRSRPLGEAAVEQLRAALEADGVRGTYGEDVVREVRTLLAGLDDGVPVTPPSSDLLRGAPLAAAAVARGGLMAGLVAADPRPDAAELVLPVLLLGMRGTVPGVGGRSLDGLERAILHGGGAALTVRRLAGSSWTSAMPAVVEAVGGWLAGHGLTGP